MKAINLQILTGTDERFQGKIIKLLAYMNSIGWDPKLKIINNCKLEISNENLKKNSVMDSQFFRDLSVAADLYELTIYRRAGFYSPFIVQEKDVYKAYTKEEPPEFRIIDISSKDSDKTSTKAGSVSDFSVKDDTGKKLRDKKAEPDSIFASIKNFFRKIFRLNKS